MQRSERVEKSTMGDTAVSILASLVDVGAARMTAHEFVRETVRKAILGGQLPGGARLVQADLAASLSVSTTPVREALFDLAAEGLIRLDPHRGGEVRGLTTDDLNEIYSIREILERYAIRLVVERMEDSSLDRPQAIHKRMFTERNPVKWVDLNRAFHLAIYEAARSPRLISILRSLMDAGVMYVGASIRREPGLRTAATKGHADILAAVKERNVNAATQAILDHMKQTIRVAMTSIPR